jgi:hypothetical protein
MGLERQARGRGHRWRMADAGEHLDAVTVWYAEQRVDGGKIFGHFRIFLE